MASLPATPWDPSTLAQARRLELQARGFADALLAGGHRSRRVGQALEFAEYREYTPGMDPRGLDWKAIGRSDRLVVRRHELETELPCTVVVDLSGDMETGASAAVAYAPWGPTKAGAAAILAATLAVALSRQGEPVGIDVLAQEPRAQAPRRGRAHLARVLMALASATPGGRASLDQAFRRVGARLRRRTVVFALTDGMEPLEDWLPALRSVVRRGGDVRVLHVWDRAELSLEGLPAGRFYSPEDGSLLAVDAPGVREAFRAEVRRWMHEVRAGVLGAGAVYVPAPTDQPPLRALRLAMDGVCGEARFG